MALASRGPRRTLVATAGVLTALALGAGSASAKTYEVTRHNDPSPGQCKANDCSLREAVLAAGSHQGGDVIELPDSGPAYVLTRPNTTPNVGENTGTRGDLDAAGNLTLRHGGSGRATIDANHVDRIIEMLDGATLTISKLEMTGGRAAYQPGVDPPRSAVARRSIGPYGAAIYFGNDGGALKMSKSVLRKNNGAEEVVNLYDPNRTSTISRSMITRNSSGPQIARLNISRSRVTDNDGFGLYLQGRSRIDRTAVSDNANTGVIMEGADTKVTNSTISGNGDGGVTIDFGAMGSITNSTITGNRTTSSGGGISVYSFGEGTSMLLNSVTIAGNEANIDGGAFDEGGGIWGTDTASYGVINSIVAGNRSAGDPEDCAGDVNVDSDGGNLISVDGVCTGFEPGAGDFLAANPKLGKLKPNGGPTKTRALLKGSKAIGRAVEVAAPKRDQRGVKRDSKPDIGAYER